MTSLKETKKLLDKISPSFCVAKWKQVTIHLGTGQTHSCHHPAPHRIPLHELEKNISALHNTQFKKEQRKKMLKGERPWECEYCWKVEDNSKDFSDRISKSNESWAEPHLQILANQPWDHDVKPSYVEVSFSNVCNFKCSYCAPNISSQWMEEIEKYGAYPTSSQFNGLDWLKNNQALPIPHNQSNPYIDAFWKWWPEIYDTLDHFRITGGEPLLNKNTFKILDYVIENPNKNLEISINTNMCPPKDLLIKLVEKIKRIKGEWLLKNIDIYTSAEAYGQQAEYIRYGMDYNMWLDNIHYLLQEIPTLNFNIMSTYNALSITTYTKFLQDILSIKKEYSRPEEQYWAIALDIPYLRKPEHQAVFILPENLMYMMVDQISFMYQNLEKSGFRYNPGKGFVTTEAIKLKRIYEMCKNNEIDSNLNRNRKDFVAFVDEYDRRRGTNFLQTFPELEEFYWSIKND